MATGKTPRTTTTGKTPRTTTPAKTARTTTPAKTARGTKAETFTAAERAAMKEAAAERRASAKKADGEATLLAKVAELPGTDRDIAERLHALVTAMAPGLDPRTWYGMPAYAQDGKVVLFLQPASKFSTRYSTLGFSDTARLDDGAMWPTAFAITAWTPAVEAEVARLVTAAIG
jgi:uncharacterized protein YdhG (YjbR/CyaY superfamily)